MSRTDFEAVYIERYGHRPRGWNDDFQVYQDAHANGAWFGWQAREVVMPDDLEELLTEVVDIHRRRGVVLTIHIEQIADMLARLNKGAGSHE